MYGVSCWWLALGGSGDSVAKNVQEQQCWAALCVAAGSPRGKGAVRLQAPIWCGPRGVCVHRRPSEYLESSVEQTVGAAVLVVGHVRQPMPNLQGAEGEGMTGG